MTTLLVDQLRDLGACSDAIAWVGDRDLAAAWAECQRGDWMLWLAARFGVDRRLIEEVRTAAAAAYAAAYAADAYAADATRTRSLADCADLVRSVIAADDVAKAMGWLP